MTFPVVVQRWLGSRSVQDLVSVLLCLVKGAAVEQVVGAFLESGSGEENAAMKKLLFFAEGLLWSRWWERSWSRAAARRMRP